MKHFGVDWHKHIWGIFFINDITHIITEVAFAANDCKFKIRSPDVLGAATKPKTKNLGLINVFFLTDGPTGGRKRQQSL